MKLKAVLRMVLFPHIAVMLILLPVSTVFLIYSMIFMGSASAVSICSYVIAFYNLTVWCLRLPELIKFFKVLKNENKLAKRWFQDERLRVGVSLYGSFIWNTAYAVFQLGLGFYHSSPWFYSLALYYISLAVMRVFLAVHTTKHRAGERFYSELIKYRICGVVFLIMNLALTVMIFYMLYKDQTFNHHEITTIALAAYTFTSFTFAIINIIKYRKYGSPVYSASKAINLASACVSMITLEATMLTTFDDGSMDALSKKLLLGFSGGAVSVFIVFMAIYMIVVSSKKIKKEKTNGKQRRI